MEFGITLLFTMGNVCLNMGVVFGVFLLLRPLLVRIVTPQQRVWLWYVFWYSALFFTAWGCISYHRVLPVTVWDLLGVSAARSYELFRGPLFLPPDYDGPGTYALTLPGGVQVPIALTDTLCLAVAAVYLAGVVCLAVWMVRRALALRRLGQRGTRTEVGLWSDFGKPKEEPDAPEESVITQPGLKTIKLNFMEWDNDTLVEVFGGTVEKSQKVAIDGQTYTVDKYKAPRNTVEIEKALRVISRYNVVIDVPRAKVVARFVWNLSRTDIAQIEVTATAQAPYGATDGVYEVYKLGEPDPGVGG